MGLFDKLGSSDARNSGKFMVIGSHKLVIDSIVHRGKSRNPSRSNSDDIVVELTVLDSRGGRDLDGHEQPGFDAGDSVTAIFDLNHVMGPANAKKFITAVLQCENPRLGLNEPPAVYSSAMERAIGLDQPFKGYVLHATGTEQMSKSGKRIVATDWKGISRGNPNPNVSSPAPQKEAPAPAHPGLAELRESKAKLESMGLDKATVSAALEAQAKVLGVPAEVLASL